jgi:putative chitinase
MRRDEAEWNRVLIQCGVKPITAAMWSIHFARVIDESTFSAGEDEIHMFLGQVLHESGMLSGLEEGLNYSAERLMAVWPTRFPTLESAKPYARNGAVLANKVYGGRMGNVEPGDGFKFRGRGLVAVTGRDNYRALGKIMRLDLERNPDLLAQPVYALLSAIAWWEGNVPDEIMGDVKKVTKRVNGGTVGLDDRTKLTGLANLALNRSA